MLTRLMLFVHALRSPTEPSEVNVELMRRQDEIEKRIRRLERENRQYDDRLRDHKSHA